MLERKVRPAITCYNVKQIDDIKKWAIKSGITKKPFLNLSLGLHGDPARRDILQTWLRYLPEECDWIVESAGRNWLPVAIEAILNGGHVRAGMEDSVFMYPHRDDLIKSSAEAVSKVRKISEELGREIATPKEAREILGLGSGK
jgi:3-keto-5-aminohexanoate cleavage enzyme